MKKNKGLSFSFLAILIIAALSPVVAQVADNSPKLSNEALKNMAGTYGYYYGQTHTIQELSKKFPSLSSQLSLALRKFDLNFKASIDNIDLLLTNETKEWLSIREKIVTEIKTRFDVSNITFNQAMEYAKDVSLRSEGNIPSPYIETLLTYHPTFQDNPVEEFNRGFAQILNTEGNLKAKGLRIQLKYPRSWKAKEANRPNIVTNLTSENGKGTESVMLMVKELPIPESTKIPQSEIEDALSERSLRQLVPSGGKFISSTRIKLDRLFGAAVNFEITQQQLDLQLKIRNVQYVLYYKNKMILIQCGVIALLNESAHLESRFKKFEPLFRVIANSFILFNQWN